MLPGWSVSRGTLLQDQTMEGSTLPPTLLSLLFSDYNMVPHILLPYQVRKSACMNSLESPCNSLAIAMQVMFIYNYCVIHFILLVVQ